MIRQRHKKVDVATSASTILDPLDTTGSTNTVASVHGNPDDAATDPSPSIIRCPPPCHDQMQYTTSTGNYCNYIFHLCSIIIVLIGIRLTFQKLYTHVECDMTWSQRQFIPVVDIMANHTHSQSSNHQYQFYKFIDQRDPRYKHLQTKSFLSVDDSSWCSSAASHIVLYVPGHGGSYQQSRSIGAHGVQLTEQNIDRRRQQAILHRLSMQDGSSKNRNTTTAKTIDNFFFDVYAFDFNEEGGAFHGAILERQATYMVKVITKLTEICRRVNEDNNEALPIHIVAHSIGGISTRLALQQLQWLNNNNNITGSRTNVKIQNVITLGTPHYMPVWSWDTSIHNLYHKLYTIHPLDDVMTTTTTTDSRSTTIISISGGLRDEMIPPKACYIDHERSAHVQFSVCTTDIMNPAAHIERNEYVPPYLGVDHRAIVWCHNVLSQVRYILYTLIHSSDGIKNDPPLEKSNRIQQNFRRELLELSSLSKRNESHDYLRSLSDLQQALKKKYGWYTAFAMETSLLYNTVILVDLFALIGTVRYLRFDCGIGDTMLPPMISIAWPPIMCTMLCSWMSMGVTRKHNIPILSMLILAFLADAIFVATKCVVQKYLRGTWRDKTNATSVVAVKTVSILTILLWTVLYVILGHNSWFRVECFVAVNTIALIVLLSMLLLTTIPRGGSVPPSQELYHDRQENYVLWMFWTLQPIVIGEVYAIFKGINTLGIYTILLPVVMRLVMNIISVRRVCSYLHPPMIQRTNRITVIALQMCRFILLPLCCWRLLTVNIQNHIILHPLPTLVMVATACDILESLMIWQWVINVTAEHAQGEHMAAKFVGTNFSSSFISYSGNVQVHRFQVPCGRAHCECPKTLVLPRFTMAKIEYGRNALFAMACFAFLERASAQLVGVDICACLPTIVTFRLNFTFECDASNVFGPGINDTTCLIETRGNENVTDFVPTRVSTVQIFELNENLAVVGDSTSDDGYIDGSEITYTSIVVRNPTNVSTPATLPRGFQISITAVNAAEQTIVNLLAIQYTGECGIFPLLEVGEQIGWVLFTDLGDPSEEFCPASVTSSPQLSPTIAPVPLLSEIPSNSPTPPIDSEMPSTIPTQSPLSLETEAPVDETAPSCPPVDNGGKSGIVNGGSGIAMEYDTTKSSDKRGKMGKSTEDMDRYLRTGGGEIECPEPNQPDLPPTKKVMVKDSVEKSPKEDVMKGSKGTKKKDKSPTKKKDEDKQAGKMDSSKKANEPDKKSSDKDRTGKGANSTSISKAKHEKSMNTTEYNSTSPDMNGKGGKGGSGDSEGQGEVSPNTKSKREVAKKSKSSTEDLDEER